VGSMPSAPSELTSSWPVVSVPVLSSATARTAPRASRWSPPLMRTPLRAALVRAAGDRDGSRDDQRAGTGDYQQGDAAEEPIEGGADAGQRGAAITISACAVTAGVYTRTKRWTARSTGARRAWACRIRSTMRARVLWAASASRLHRVRSLSRGSERAAIAAIGVVTTLKEVWHPVTHQLSRPAGALQVTRRGWGGSPRSRSRPGLQDSASTARCSPAFRGSRTARRRYVGQAPPRCLALRSDAAMDRMGVLGLLGADGRTRRLPGLESVVNKATRERASARVVRSRRRRRP
jgi:hypothetical protein